MVIRTVDDRDTLMQATRGIEHLNVNARHIQQEGKNILEGGLPSCVQQVDEEGIL